MRLHAVAVAVVAAAMGATLAAMPAAGEPGVDERAELDVRLGARAPGTATGVSFRVFYKHPDDAEAKPPPLTAALFELPRGTTIDGSATPRCEASDAELRAGGRDACPEESQVGTGSLTAITGFGPPVDPVSGDVTVFNGGDQLIELVTAPGTDAVLGFDRLTIEGGALRAHPPNTPGGPPEGRTAIREIRVDIPARGRLFVTPPSCPSGGTWASRGSFGFADGGSSTVVSTTPCEPRRSGATSARLRVRPRRAVRGKRVRFRVRAVARPPSCARGATVRFGGRRVQTGQGGRAVARVRFRRAGRRVVRLKKRGCPTARARVRVMRP